MKADDSRLLVTRHYSTDKKGNRVVKGVFVGFYDLEAKKIRTGFSRVNMEPRDKDGKTMVPDKFNMEIGLAMAIQEAVLPSQKIKDTEDNQYFWDCYIAFKDRASRYFQMDVPLKRKSLDSFLFGRDPNSVSVNPVVADKAEKIAYMGSLINSEADEMLKQIAKRFNELGYSPRKISGLVKGIGIADKEGLELIKKHFPTLDVSDIKVV